MKNLISVITRSELWLSIAVILGAIYQADVLPESWAKLVAVALSVLTALGYGVARTVKKVEIAKVAAVAEAARSPLVK